mmetsp:Transcript_2026/g.6145  ORF Transcript_2026/g.6145 Transcript_2026/m.6145 type:complete len:512 (-) Transcript_2026:21-1556(-)
MRMTKWALVVVSAWGWQFGGPSGPRRGLQHVAPAPRWSPLQRRASFEGVEGQQVVGESRGEAWLAPLAESVKWLRAEAFVEEWEESRSEEELVELPLVVVDAPVLPTGSYSMPATEASVREMYDEILCRGSRRFAVTLGERESSGELAKGVLSSVDDEVEYANNVAATAPRREARREPARLAEVGCVAYWTDVKATEAGVRVCEHSIQAERIRIRQVQRRGDRYVCRAAIVREAPILSETPAAADRDDERSTTFAGMLARLESLNGSIQDLLLALAAKKADSPPRAAGLPRPRRRAPSKTPRAAAPRHERIVLDELAEVAALQKRLDEDVCFREEAIAALGAGKGSGVGSLWHLANSCWLSYLKARATNRARRLYAELHDRLVDFLATSGRLPPEFFAANALLVAQQQQQQKPELALSISELPPELQRDLLRLKARVADELEPIVAQHRAAQLLLDADDHEARCLAFAALLRSEKRRLQARASLREFLDSETAAARRQASPRRRNNKRADD